MSFLWTLGLFLTSHVFSISANGYCVDSGEFKYPQWQLPIEFQEQVIKNPKCQLCLVMSNKECKEFTAHFNPKCVTRRTTNKTSFHLASYEEAYIKLLNTSNFKEYFYTVRPIHTPIHTNMGNYAIYSS